MESLFAGPGLDLLAELVEEEFAFHRSVEDHRRFLHVPAELQHDQQRHG